MLCGVIEQFMWRHSWPYQNIYMFDVISVFMHQIYFEQMLTLETWKRIQMLIFHMVEYIQPFWCCVTTECLQIGAKLPLVQNSYFGQNVCAVMYEKYCFILHCKRPQDPNWGSSRPTVHPKKYAHGFCFAVLCCGYTLTDFPISTRLTSLALWQSNDCLSDGKATLMNMDKYFMWNHYERLHNHNKAKHNKTVCIFLGIYCSISNDTVFQSNCLPVSWDALAITRNHSHDN